MSLEQNFKKKNQNSVEKDNSLNKLASEFADIKSTPIKQEPKTRIVILSYKSCCGCGCDYIDVEREVPFDSKLKTGDRIKDLEPDDKF